MNDGVRYAGNESKGTNSGPVSLRVRNIDPVQSGGPGRIQSLGQVKVGVGTLGDLLEGVLDLKVGPDLAKGVRGVVVFGARRGISILILDEVEVSTEGHKLRNRKGLTESLDLSLFQSVVVTSLEVDIDQDLRLVRRTPRDQFDGNGPTLQQGGKGYPTSGKTDQDVRREDNRNTQGIETDTRAKRDTAGG